MSLLVGFVFLIPVSLDALLCRAASDPNAARDEPLVTLGAELKASPLFVGAVRWPRLDYENVKSNIVEPNLVNRKKFLTVVEQVIEPNCLPSQMQGKVRFLRNWPVQGEEGCVLQYEREPYVIRIRNQVTHVQVTETRRDSTHWITVFIQRKDKGRWFDPKDPNVILRCVDGFLTKNVNSSAQRYLGMKNSDGSKMDRPMFRSLDQGYLLAYPVLASGVAGVTIWTDGSSLIIHLQELRKVRGPSSGD